MLWGTINTLQLLVLGALFSLIFPSNSVVMFNIFTTISQLSILPTTTITRLYNFEDSSALTSNFEAMGYSGRAMM